MSWSMTSSREKLCLSKKTEAACKDVPNECEWATKKPLLCYYCRPRTMCHVKIGRMTENAQPIDSKVAAILRAIADNKWD